MKLAYLGTERTKLYNSRLLIVNITALLMNAIVEWLTAVDEYL